MEAPNYDALCHLFHHDNVDEFREQYARLGPIATLQDASFFSLHRQISPSTKRAILELTVDYIDPLFIIVNLNGLINFDCEVEPPRPEICTWVKAEAGYGILLEQLSENSPGEPDLPIPSTRQQILKEIGGCSHEDLQRLIHFLCIHDDFTRYFTRPVVISLIERLDRILKDDRFFYSLLLNGVTLAQLDYAPTEHTLSNPIIIVAAVDADAFACGEIDMQDIVQTIEGGFEEVPEGILAISISRSIDPDTTIEAPRETDADIFNDAADTVTPDKGNFNTSWVNELNPRASLHEARVAKYRQYWHLDR